MLLACKSGSLQTLERELTRANRVWGHLAVPGSGHSSLAQEQAELLEAIVVSLRDSTSGRIPCDGAEISLLAHLARG